MLELSKPEKISFNKLAEVVEKFNVEGFNYPDEYKLSFPIVLACRYCKKKSMTKQISVFDGEIVCNCKHCGGRHRFTIKGLKEIKKTEHFIKIMIALIVLLIAFFL